MEYTINSKKSIVLNIAAILAIIAGIVLSCGGLYFFYILTEYDISEFSKSQITQIKIMDASFAAVMIEGIYYIVAGFAALINNGAVDYCKAFMKYAVIMSVAGVADFIMIIFASEFGIGFPAVLLVAVPLICGLLYLLGAVNHRRIFQHEA